VTTGGALSDSGRYYRVCGTNLGIIWESEFYGVEADSKLEIGASRF